ncbi:MAG: hypothetical protein LIQ30_00875 [Planctomycetes bacterium]|nr:hypothetical protein [Planctomycetota bacterium]
MGGQTRGVFFGVVLMFLFCAGIGATDFSGSITGTIAAGDYDIILSSATIESAGKIIITDGMFLVYGDITNNSSQSPGILIQGNPNTGASPILYFDPDATYYHNGTGSITAENHGSILISGTVSTGRNISDILNNTTLTNSWVTFYNRDGEAAKYINGDISFASINDSFLNIHDNLVFTGNIDTITNGIDSGIKLSNHVDSVQNADVDVVFKGEVKTHDLNIEAVDMDLENPNE